MGAVGTLGLAYPLVCEMEDASQIQEKQGHVDPSRCAHNKDGCRGEKHRDTDVQRLHLRGLALLAGWRRAEDVRVLVRFAHGRSADRRRDSFLDQSHNEPLSWVLVACVCDASLAGSCNGTRCPLVDANNAAGSGRLAFSFMAIQACSTGDGRWPFSAWSCRGVPQRRAQADRVAAPACCMALLDKRDRRLSSFTVASMLGGGAEHVGVPLPQSPAPCVRYLFCFIPARHRLAWQAKGTSKLSLATGSDGIHRIAESRVHAASKS